MNQPPSAIILNGTPATDTQRSELTHALSTPAIITEKGGYLFKSRLDSNTFHFGVLPNFLNGERTYHYNIDLGEDPHTLIGSINVNGTLTILFKLPPHTPASALSENDRDAYRAQYSALAQFLLQHGLPETVLLDPPTRQALAETGLYATVPEVVGGLVERGI